MKTNFGLYVYAFFIGVHFSNQTIYMKITPWIGGCQFISGGTLFFSNVISKNFFDFRDAFSSLCRWLWFFKTNAVRISHC